MALYHDRFTDLQQEIVELLHTPLVSLMSRDLACHAHSRVRIARHWRRRSDN